MDFGAIMAWLPPLDPLEGGLIGIGVFLAGILRGFTGFGFALAAVPLLTLILDPIAIGPAIQILALLAGAELLRKAWRLADRAAILRLLAGALIGVPLGVLLLNRLPAAAMRIGIGGILLIAVFALWRGRDFRLNAGRFREAGIGFLSGLLNGATAMGGPPVILYFLARRVDAAIVRASLLVYFFFLSLWSLGSSALGGLIDRHVLILAALLFPAMAIGNRCGDLLFNKAHADRYRPIALAFLGSLALIAILRAFMDQF